MFIINNKHNATTCQRSGQKYALFNKHSKGEYAVGTTTMCNELQ